jgi:hypothetical protein
LFTVIIAILDATTLGFDNSKCTHPSSDTHS